MLSLFVMLALVMFVQIAFAVMLVILVLWGVAAGIDRLRGRRPVDPAPELDAAAIAHRERMAAILGVDHDLLPRK